MKLTPAKKRRIAMRAAKLLKRKSVTWRAGTWIEHGHEYVEPEWTMGRIRQWFRSKGLDTYNKECGVCLEGALLLSAIEDKDVPDEVTGRHVLNQFQGEITMSAPAQKAIAVHDPPRAGMNIVSIPTLNDRFLKQESDPEQRAIEILEAAGRPEVKS